MEQIDLYREIKINYELYESHRRYTIKWIKWSNFMSYGEENFFDFIYIAETEEIDPHPEGNESKKFKWFSYEELLEYEIKPHVKNTALAVLDFYRLNKVR